MIRALAIVATILFAQEASASRALPIVRDIDGVMSIIEKAGADGKPVVVHFFATWCEPCRKEMPVLRKLIPRVEARGAQVILFSLDEVGAEKSVVPRFLAKHSIAGKSYLLDAPEPDVVTKAIDPAWTAELPATFVFRKGARTHSILGPMKNARVLDEALK